jgi:hypothetical protein
MAMSKEESSNVVEFRPNWTPPSDKQLFKHKGRANSPEISIRRNRNTIPKGEPFIWQTQEMLSSPAWRALPSPARRAIDRISLEHMHHAGTENGKLIVTYDDFENYGIDRHSVRLGILAAQALGFIVVTDAGHAGAGDTRRAARYALTWLDRWDGAPRTNEWNRIETLADAKKAVAEVRATLKAEAAERSRPQPAGRVPKY